MDITDKEGARIFVLFWTLVLFGIGVYLAFTHPDMTRTRLLLNYWYVYVPAVLLGGLYQFLRVER